jgi:hypothetical protein
MPDTLFGAIASAQIAVCEPRKDSGKSPRFTQGIILKEFAAKAGANRAGSIASGALDGFANAARTGFPRPRLAEKPSNASGHIQPPGGQGGIIDRRSNGSGGSRPQAYGSVRRSLRARKKPGARPGFFLADRVGFEPTIPLQVCRISSAVPSTTRPPVRRAEFRDFQHERNGAFGEQTRTSDQSWTKSVLGPV